MASASFLLVRCGNYHFCHVVARLNAVSTVFEIMFWQLWSDVPATLEWRSTAFGTVFRGLWNDAIGVDLVT